MPPHRKFITLVLSLAVRQRGVALKDLGLWASRVVTFGGEVLLDFETKSLRDTRDILTKALS